MRTLPALAIALACCLLAAPAAQAQPWTFDLAIYGYFPRAGGTTNFPPDSGGGGGSDTVTIDGDPLLKHLEFAFMAQAAAHKGDWGVFADYIRVDFGHSASGSRAINIGGVLPVGATADIDYHLKGNLFTLAGSWKVPTSPAFTMDLLFGARMLDIDTHLGFALSGNIGSIPVQERSGNRDASQTNWDAIVGVRGRVPLGASGRWFAPYYFDVGAGESRLTWQAMAGVGYAFGWGDVVGAWRYIDYDMKSGHPLESLNFNGPSIAAVFRW